MIDISRVLNQVLTATQGAQQGPQTRTGSVPGVSQRDRNGAGIPGAELLGGLNSGALGAGALAGVAGLLLGNKRVRKMAGGAIQVGAVAAVGALAYHAYQNYRQGKPVVPKSVTDMIGQVTGQVTSQDAGENARQIETWIPPQPERSEAVARLLLKTMVAAAASDGHLDGVEYDRIRQQLRGSGLGEDEQLFLSQVIMQRSTPAELAAQATTPELKAEVYAAARLAIDADHADEHKWLDQLAAALALDPVLRTHLDAIGGVERAAA